jgi:hypothetical protein
LSVLTRANTCLDGVTVACHTHYVTLSPRDRQLVRLADYFKQLTTGQLGELAFADSASRTSLDRALRRLVEDKYLARTERRRLVGGAHGGSGEYVYQLGSAGWQVCKRDGRYHLRAIDYHALSITEVYVQLMRAQRAGELEVTGFTPEPECHVSVHGADLRPDILVEMKVPGRVRPVLAWLEVDLGTERQARLTEKLDRYVYAFNHGKPDPFPRVVFVAHDEERTREIEFLLSRRPSDDPPLFSACEMGSFPQLFIEKVLT